VRPLLTLVALSLAATPLDEAKDHLKAGRVDEVFFALDGKKLSDAEKPEAAKVLADAAKKSLEKNDGVMALQLAKMAGKLDPKNVGALEQGSRASRSLEQFQDAETMADAWLKAEPQSADAAVWRAELHLDAGEWTQALALLDPAKNKSPKAKELRTRAEKELASRQTAISGLRQLERELAKAQSEYKPGDRDLTLASAGGGSGGVVLYGTSWCGYCKKAEAWLKKKGIPFQKKDVEKDQDAARELAAKATRAGARVSGVPVIDVKGTLVQGFDERRLEQLL
jgi:glutaredoxin